MGQLMSKKPKLEINDVDRAVLTLKSQMRKLEQQRARIQSASDHEQQVARELVAAGRKERALLALKRRKLREGQASKLEALLINLEQSLLNIESAQAQQSIFGALKQANGAVKELQQAAPLEEVEQLMQDGADAKAYEDSLRQLLGDSLRPEESEAAEQELAELEAQLLDSQGLQMPQVPSKTAAASEEAAGPARTPGAEEVEAGVETLLDQLPSVPSRQAQAATDAEGEGERVMLAA